MGGLKKMDLFWSYDKSIEPVCTRNIYALEYQVFNRWYNFIFYLAAITVFMTHAMLGWKNASPVLGIKPKSLLPRVNILGYCLVLLIGLIYLSMPFYVVNTQPYVGE